MLCYTTVTFTRSSSNGLFLGCLLEKWFHTSCVSWSNVFGLQLCRTSCLSGLSDSHQCAAAHSGERSLQQHKHCKREGGCAVGFQVIDRIQPSKGLSGFAKRCLCPENFSQETVCVDLIAGQIDKQQHVLDSHH